MKIPKYWARETGTVESRDGDKLAFGFWRGSRESVEAARDLARAAVKAVTDKARRGEELDRYDYGERPLREELLEEIEHDNQLLGPQLSRWRSTGWRNWRARPAWVFEPTGQLPGCAAW